MGEMKIEHVLLFLVGAFLVYHMMKGCGCNKVEGMSKKGSPHNLGEDCITTEFGCCPDGSRAATSYVDPCLHKVVDKNTGKTSKSIRNKCPPRGVTKACYSEDQRCVYDETCLHPELITDPVGGGGCIEHRDGKKTPCRICGKHPYIHCPQGVKDDN